MSSLSYSFFTEKGFQLTKKYTIPRTYLGMGSYAAYKDFGEDIWRIGYGSEIINVVRKTLNSNTTDNIFINPIDSIVGNLKHNASAIKIKQNKK